MKDLNYFIQLGKLSEGILSMKSLVDESSSFYKKLQALEEEFCEKLPSYSFYDPDNLLSSAPLSIYSANEKQYFSLAMNRFAEDIKQNVYLVEYTNGSADDMYKKIDFKIRVLDKTYTVQFKTRCYSSKKEFMDDVTVRDLDLFYGEADLLIESIYEDTQNTIVEQHFLNFKKLRDLLNDTLLIENHDSLEGWTYQRPGWFKKRNEDPLDVDVIRYNKGKSYYCYLANGSRLGIDHHAYILLYAPGTNMIPFPNELLEKIDVDLNNPDILKELP